MTHRKLTALFSTALLALAAACTGQSPDTVDRKSESTTQTAAGTVTTTSESRQVGTTLEAKSETKTDTASGTTTAISATIVGTVTVYTAGKSLEVLTGEKTTHRFKLDDEYTTYSIDRTVAVGTRVTVVDTTGDDKVHRLSVRLEA